jgi:hypothetical protein
MRGAGGGRGVGVQVTLVKSARNGDEFFVCGGERIEEVDAGGEGRDWLLGAIQQLANVGAARCLLEIGMMASCSPWMMIMGQLN